MFLLAAALLPIAHTLAQSSDFFSGAENTIGMPCLAVTFLRLCKTLWIYGKTCGLIFKGWVAVIASRVPRLNFCRSDSAMAVMTDRGNPAASSLT
uniref:Putative secreted protein n=1 Tax=Rhipicephalus microplus TaxID=6941 RepID=A0A6M2DA09_RHIMP